MEQPGELSRDLCLTNKIFTYLLAGNAIIFSDTSAQRKFYEENPGIGAIYECGDIAALKNILTDYQQNISKVGTLRINAQNAAETKYNWEIEKASLIKIIEEALRK